ncbi:hypothetical protein PIB30_009563 [Stylosanthes scabra]|uniref:Uncharacterized protein n=1 Tax=Stylosanthes scabra TaxID=79078 RepID=A0ABU6Q555_9FABA|nr:hypothetical protein [Stylosanthes scabra]
MDRKRKSLVAKGKGKLAMPPTQKSPRLAGLPPSLPPVSPKFMLRPNKLLVLAIAAANVETHHKAQESVQAPVVEPLKDTKGKKDARISVKPLRNRFSQRIIARGGPSRPKPKKVEVIDLVSGEKEEAQAKEAALEQPPLVANQDEEEDPNYEEEEEEDPDESVVPEEAPSSWSLLSPFPATPELAPGEYDDPHYWNFDGDLISGAPMWPVASQLLLRTGILPKRRRRTVHLVHLHGLETGLRTPTTRRACNFPKKGESFK